MLRNPTLRRVAPAGKVPRCLWAYGGAVEAGPHGDLEVLVEQGRKLVGRVAGHGKREQAEAALAAALGG